MISKSNKNYNVTMLFICIIIALIPTMFYKYLVEVNMYTVLNGIAFLIQIIIGIHLIIVNKIDYKNIIKKYGKYIVIGVVILILSQGINLIRGLGVKFNDLVNIGAITCNISIFVILIGKIKIEEDSFIKFMKLILTLAMIACAYNLIVIIENIPNILNATNSYSVSLSSFFPNRNQFGLFLVIAILANMFILDKEKDKRYKISIIILIINLILSMSRTTILAAGIAIIVKIFMNGQVIQYIKNNMKKCIIILGVLMIIPLIIITINKDILNTIDDLFIRSETILSGSGRTNIWENVIKIITENNFISGVGRFEAIELLSLEIPRSYSQFHNVIIEMYATGGIIGISAYIFLLYKVFTKIRNSNIYNKYKYTYLSTFIVYLVVSTFEGMSRFSIGYVDTIAMIFYFVIPLMFSNNVKKIENK